MGSYLGPGGYFHTASIPFTNADADVDFTFPTRLVDTDNNYYASRNNSSNNNNDNLPSFPDTFGPTTATTTDSNIGHLDFSAQVPYSSGYSLVLDPLYQYRDFAETQTAQFQQPPLPLPLPNSNFGGGNTHSFCGGFGPSDESPSPDYSSSGVLNVNLNRLANQGFHHPLSSASASASVSAPAFLPNPAFEQPNPVVSGQGQSQVQQQCACAPHRPQDSNDPPAHSHSPAPAPAPPSHSFDNTIDFGSSSSNSNSDVWHLHPFNHNHNHSHQPPLSPTPSYCLPPSHYHHNHNNLRSLPRTTTTSIQLIPPTFLLQPLPHLARSQRATIITSLLSPRLTSRHPHFRH
ncbi:hypothetical protein PG997_005108 [Apiospora hydei]|uniref:Uncharacterized protein n=1 Tax=Apiospora hydei TaxID=1337664 RepID=A0ABR1X401_9PEZI